MERRTAKIGMRGLSQSEGANSQLRKQEVKWENITCIVHSITFLCNAHICMEYHVEIALLVPTNAFNKFNF